MSGIQNTLQEENNIKRPLFWITGAIVLGEVIAYWFHQMADHGGAGSLQNRLAVFLVILAAGAFLWIVIFVRGRRFLGLGLLGFLLFFIGAARMSLELRPHPLLAVLEHEGGYGAVLEGRLDAESFKNGTYTLAVTDATLRLGDENDEKYKLSGVLVSVKPEMWEEAKQAALTRTGGERAGPSGGGPPAESGIKIRVEGRPEAFSAARNPGEFDYAMYYRSQKQICRMKANRISITDASFPPLSGWVGAFRRHVSAALGVLCDEEDRGIYEAVILGDKSTLSEDIRGLYQKSGIAHLLAVSGLHVSLIGMGLYRGFRRLGLHYGKAGIAAAMVLFFYGCVTGFGSSVFRAIFMIVCSFLAAYLGRTYDLVSAMSLSLLFLSLDSPFLLFTSGLQLSYGAVFSIGCGSDRMRDWRQSESPKESSGAKEAFTERFFTSLFIQIFTYPIILYHFFEFPIYGIFLNLLVIPLMAYVVGSGIAGLFVYSLGGLFFPAVLKGLAVGIMGTGHYILEFYSFLCRLASELPFYSVIAGRPSLWIIIVYYVAVFVSLYWKNGDIIKQRKRFLAVSGAVSLLLLMHPVTGLSVTFLDVGQGDGIFLQTAGNNILVDGGSTQVKNLGKSRLVPFLKSKGISRLDFVFVSHGDQDHISGIEYLLEEETGIRIKNIVFSGISKEEKTGKRLAELSQKRGITVRYMEAGQVLKLKKLNLTCIYPAGNTIASDKNEQSLVLLAEYGDFSLLLTGDVEDGGEREIVKVGQKMLPERVTVLKAAHHGSDSSTGAEFLRRVVPDVAVLSYGNGNSYGHPSKDVVGRLEELGVDIWQTGESGAVMMETDGKTVRIKGFIEKLKVRNKFIAVQP